MAIYKNCTCDIYYQDEGAALNDPGYEVRIDWDELVISYEGDHGWINYQGKDLGGGHYSLTADTVNGRSLVHRATPDAEIIEGCWEEDGCFGMWRFHLID